MRYSVSGSVRCVFDTNTIISAFLFENGNPGRALKEALRRGRLLLSLQAAEEVAVVLRREKFDKYVRRRTREEFLKALIRDAVFVAVTEEIHECRDPDDDKFLELAVSGDATHIVSGDGDLQALSPFRGIPILSAKQFLESLV
jgi:putative PIN family toxin of toxin-antitoxin system